MSSLLDESVKQMVKQRFSDLKEPVKVIVFSTKDHCLLCNEMLKLVEAVGELSEKIDIEHCNCEENDPKAKKYGIKHHPALAIIGEKDYGIRFYGVPAGKEFTTFIESIMLVSSREAILSPQVIDMLESIKKPVNLKVFVTLECPYCPAMVLRAQKLALMSDNISADMVEASQFSELAAEFDIFGVPNTIINNGKGSVEGLVPEEAIIQAILESFERTGDTSPFT